MNIGENIKQQRQRCGLTQRDLAEQVHVTYQAVSRWEKNDAEPSFDCLMKMTQIFGCTINDLFGVAEPKKEPEPAPVQQERIIERIVEKEPEIIAVHQQKVTERIVEKSPEIVAICKHCQKPIYKKEDCKKYNHSYLEGFGPSHHSVTKTEILCASCYAKQILADNEQAQKSHEAVIAELKKKRKRSFIFPSIIAAVVIAVASLFLALKETYIGIAGFGIALLSFLFFGCVFLGNNFIPDVWLTIVSWGFVKMPGVIMEFSIGGIIIGFMIKIFLWLLGFAFAFLCTLFATAVGMVLSLFVYPFALRKNIKQSKQ